MRTVVVIVWNITVAATGSLAVAVVVASWFLVVLPAKLIRRLLPRT